MLIKQAITDMLVLCFATHLVFPDFMEEILKAKLNWQQAAASPPQATAASFRVAAADSCARGVAQIGQVKRRGGPLPLTPCPLPNTKKICFGILFEKAAEGGKILRSAKKSGKVQSAAGSGHVQFAGTSGHVKTAVKSSVVVAAVTTGHGEAAAKLCEDKQCILNICAVKHVGLKPQTIVCEAAAARQDSQLWSRSVAAMEENVKMSLAESTAKKYDYWWSRFNEFCRKTGAVKMPFSGRTAAVFLSHLAESAVGLGGADAARTALRHFFLVHCPASKCPTDGPEVTLVMKGIHRRFEKPVVKKAPLTSVEFYKLLNFLTDKASFKKVRLCQLRLAAQISLMFLAFSRFEESSALKRSQVVRCQEDLAVNFLKGKNFQYGEARRSVIASQPGLLNPVRVILAYMVRLAEVDKSSDGFLFPALRVTTRGESVLPRPASYESVLRQFKEAVVAAGVAAEPAAYGLHSMRRGAVTSAINNGASDHAVQKSMRVASGSTVRRYATLSDGALKSASIAIFKKM